MRLTRINENAATGAPAPPGLLEMLLGCHANIHHFVQLSQTLAGAEGVAPGEIAEAAAAVFRYFRYALPLHEADENETLFPRLREALPQGGLVFEAAETMVDQHKAIDELAAELLTICGSLDQNPERLPSVARRLSYVTRALEQMFSAHLTLEESVIFPALRELLTPIQIGEMAIEMIDRRRAPLGTIHLVR